MFRSKKGMFSLFILTFVLMIGLIGCSNDSSLSDNNNPKENESDDKSYHFVFIPKVVHPWYEAVEAGALAAAEEFSKQGYDIKIEFDAPPAADVLQHTSKIESVVSKRPDIISVAILDEASETAIINDSVDAGIKMFTFDTDAPGSNRLMYVGHSKNKEDGAASAELLAERMNYEGEVAILVGSISAPNHSERVEGFKKAMEQYPDIKIVDEQADNDNMERAVSLAENILQAHPNVKGFFGSNASNPIGIARAVKDAGKANEVFIVGMDDLPETIDYIEEGVITGTVVQNVFDIGYESVKYMIEEMEGRSIPEEHPTGSYIVTKENLDEYKSKQ